MVVGSIASFFFPSKSQVNLYEYERAKTYEQENCCSRWCERMNNRAVLYALPNCRKGN